MAIVKQGPLARSMEIRVYRESEFHVVIGEHHCKIGTVRLRTAPPKIERESKKVEGGKRSRKRMIMRQQSQMSLLGIELV
ncbi:hypothetical protein BJX63DRAFT_412857 [Aspergillus granulosus]|uniref:Uncharacterized protein n=1 Tax=Aspergillus granulosus TaxID=176169 RepID=A0ABR4GVN9_9EURO